MVTIPIPIAVVANTIAQQAPALRADLIDCINVVLHEDLDTRFQLINRLGDDLDSCARLEALKTALEGYD